MLPLFQFAGDLVTDPVTFEENLKANESLSLENMRALSRCVPRTRANAVVVVTSHTPKKFLFQPRGFLIRKKKV